MQDTDKYVGVTLLSMFFFSFLNQALRIQQTFWWLVTGYWWLCQVDHTYIIILILYILSNGKIFAIIVIAMKGLLHLPRYIPPSECQWESVSSLQLGGIISWQQISRLPAKLPSCQPNVYTSQPRPAAGKLFSFGIGKRLHYVAYQIFQYAWKLATKAILLWKSHPPMLKRQTNKNGHQNSNIPCENALAVSNFAIR